MLKVTREISLDNKGASIFEFDCVPNETLDGAIYDAGVQLERKRFENGSLAEQLFAQLRQGQDSSNASAKSDE
jgi:hypothetical protein